MTAEILPFEAEVAGPRDRRAGADRRRRGLRGAARPAADARAPAEGRSRQNFDPGARRPVSRLHRGGAPAAARTRRRLSRDGGVARLSQIAPAAARGGAATTGRAPRTWPTRWRCGCKRLEAIREAAEPADRAAAARPRRVRARRSRSRSPTIKRPEWSATLYDLLSAYARAAAEAGARACALSRSARSGRSPRRARRSSG